MKLREQSNVLMEYSAIVFIGILILVGSLVAPGFLSLGNISNVLRRVAFLGFVSLGMTFVIVGAGIDLSIGSILALASVITAIFQHWGIYYGYVDKLSFLVPEILIFLLVILVGCLIGLLNGVVITKFKVPDFAATLGMMLTIRGLAFTVTGSRTVFGVGPKTQWLGSGEILSIPFSLYLFLFLALLTYLVLHRTPFGKRIFAIGENKKAARLSGVRTDLHKLMTYVISGALAAIAGLVLTGQLGVGEPRLASGLELDAIAAVVLGGTDLYGGKGGIIQTMLGVLVIALIRNIMNLLGIPPNPQLMVRAAVLFVAILFQSQLRSLAKTQ